MAKSGFALLRAGKTLLQHFRILAVNGEGTILKASSWHTGSKALLLPRWSPLKRQGKRHGKSNAIGKISCRGAQKATLVNSQCQDKLLYNICEPTKLIRSHWKTLGQYIFGFRWGPPAPEFSAQQEPTLLLGIVVEHVPPKSNAEGVHLTKVLQWTFHL